MLKSFVIFLALILPSFLFGQTWTQIASGTNKNLTAISFPSSTVGYIGGEDSLLLKTFDGGQTWNEVNYSGITFFPNGDNIVDIKFVTDLVGFMTVGPYAGSYKTVDGGLTWATFDAIYSCYTTNLFFFNENNGFLGGSGCFSGEIINKLDTIWKETNITPLSINQGGQITNFDFFDNIIGMASSSGQYFFKTTDGGDNWDTIPNSLTSLDSMTSVLFYTADTILATYTSPSLGTLGVLISYDGGFTWQDEMTSATFFYPNMFASLNAGNGNLFIGGENYLTTGGIDPGIIYESHGSITNWSYENVSESIRDIDLYSDSVVFAVGQNGYIITKQIPMTLSAEATGAEIDFKIYPNPNQGEFTLKTGNATIEEIAIIDNLGNQVYDKTTKSKSQTIHVSNLAAGMYQVRIQSNGKTIVKKVVIQ